MTSDFDNLTLLMRYIIDKVEIVAYIYNFPNIQQ